MDRLLTRQEVEQRVGIKRSALYRMMRADEFPLPLKIGPRAVRWPLTEIEAWIAARPRARGEAHMATPLKRIPLGGDGKP